MKVVNSALCGPFLYFSGTLFSIESVCDIEDCGGGIETMLNLLLNGLRDGEEDKGELSRCDDFNGEGLRPDISANGGVKTIFRRPGASFKAARRGGVGLLADDRFDVGIGAES